MTAMSSTARSSAPNAPTSLSAIIVLTAVCSVGTGVLWNGLAFIVKHDYAYAEEATLVLYIALAFVYVIAAFVTGRVLVRLEQWVSPRSALVLLLAAQTAACAALALVEDDWMMWLTAGVVSITGAMIWPIVESYLSAGRHGKELRWALGWWNIVWTGSVGAALFLMAPLVEEYARYAIVGFGGLNMVGFAALTKFSRRPGAHDHADSVAHVTSEYPHLLKGARVLLPMSYVLNSGMAPLLPFVLGSLGVEALYETPTAATWTVARVLAVAIMWRVTFWHGRWGTLILGAVSMAIGFAFVVSAAHLWMIFLGLSMFGVGMGIVYYAALYYAMAVGRAEVNAGGIHEALIGGGYMVGPLLCLLSMQGASVAREHGASIADGNVIIVVMWTVLAGSAVLVVRAYLRARRARVGAR
jgi:MFS family permease